MISRTSLTICLRFFSVACWRGFAFWRSARQFKRDNVLFRKSKVPMEEFWRLLIKEEEVPSVIDEAMKA